MFGDRAIESAGADALEREPFAEVLANAVHMPEGSDGVVVALEGRWGEGKTSIFNMVADKLRNNSPETIVVRFNPWLISGFESLCEAFLINLAASIGKEASSDAARQSAKQLLGFAKFLTPIKLIPGVEPWGTVVENILTQVGRSAESMAELNKLDLEGRKQRVERHLRDLNRPIVVLIDDVDRLNRGEIKTIFQLIRSVGDFRNVTYLVGYDPEQVSAALSEGGSQTNGREFLEKIVQLSYPVPRLTYRQMRSYLSDHVRSFVSSHEVDLKGFEESRLGQALDGGVVHAMRHPRDVIRLTNRLRISVRPTRYEVNFADVLAFEALSLRFEGIAAQIRKHPHRFVSDDAFPHEEHHGITGFEWYLASLSEEGGGEEDDGGWKSRLLDDLSHEDRETAARLIGFLFPHFYSSENVPAPGRLASDQGLSLSAPLLSLLSVGPAAGVPSTADVTEFLHSPGARRSVLKWEADDSTLAAWFLACEKRVQEADSWPHVPRLMEDVIWAADYSYNEVDENVIYPSMHFVVSVLYELKVGRRNEAFLTISDTPDCLSLSEKVILWAAADAGVWRSQYSVVQHDPEKRLIPDESVVRDGIANWVSRVEDKACDLDALMFEPEVASVLFRWGQFSSRGFDGPKEFVSKLLSSPDGTERFASMFGEGHGVEGIEKLVDDKELLVRDLDALEEVELGSHLREWVKAQIVKLASES